MEHQFFALAFCVAEEIGEPINELKSHLAGIASEFTGQWFEIDDGQGRIKVLTGRVGCFITSMVSPNL